MKMRWIGAEFKEGGAVMQKIGTDWRWNIKTAPAIKPIKPVWNNKAEVMWNKDNLKIGAK